MKSQVTGSKVQNTWQEQMFSAEKEYFIWKEVERTS